MTRLGSLSRRVLAIVASASVGLVGALALATPAQAHHTYIDGNPWCDTDTGEWVVDWTVTSSPHGVEYWLNVVVHEPADSSLSGLPVNVERPRTEAFTGQQRLPGDAPEASLRVEAEWDNGHEHTLTEKIQFREPCEEEESVQVPIEASSDCDSLTVRVTNPLEASEDPGLEAAITSGDEMVVLTLAPGETDQASFDAKEGTVTTVTIGEQSWEIAWEEPADCDEPDGDKPEDGGDGGGDDELPVTGAQSALIAGGALLLLTLGGAMYFVARRRRITFTA